MYFASRSLLLGILQVGVTVSCILAHVPALASPTLTGEMGVNGEVQDLYHGTIVLPDGFTVVRGGIDSAAGEIKRESDDFTIEYDIGYMAGSEMTSSRAPKCSWFRQQTINGNYCSMGMLSHHGRPRIITTFYDLAIRSELLRAAVDNLKRQSASETDVREQLRLEEQIYDEYRQARAEDRRGSAPANFAADVRSEADLLDYMLVVTSYCPFRGPTPRGQVQNRPDNSPAGPDRENKPERAKPDRARPRE